MCGFLGSIEIEIGFKSELLWVLMCELVSADVDLEELLDSPEHLRLQGLFSPSSSLALSERRRVRQDFRKTTIFQ